MRISEAEFRILTTGRNPPMRKRAPRPPGGSELERAFVTHWRQVAPRSAPTPVAEWRFEARRKWAFDFAFPAYRVAVELEGGEWSGGRHTTGAGFVRDCEKYNAAALAGWIVLRYPGSALEKDPRGAVLQVLAALASRAPTV